MEYLARKEGREDVQPGMPAELMRRRFQERPPASFPRPMRGSLGSQHSLRIPHYGEWLVVAFSDGARPVEKKPVIQEVKAEDELERQWSQQAKPKNDMAELRKAVKAAGLTAPRTATKADLKAMLDGEQNAS